MLQQRSHKEKFYWLTGGTLLAIILMWSVAIKPTLEQNRTRKRLAHNLASIEQAPRQIERIKQEIAQIQSLTGVQDDIDNMHAYLHREISRFCEKRNIALMDYPPVIRYEVGDMLIETNEITVSGGFHNLLRLLHFMEYELNAGRIVSLTFFTERDNRKKTTGLLMTLYVQHINNRK